MLSYKGIQSATEKAREAGLPLDFKFSFAPFQLDPTLPESPGENKRERYIRRFGGPERVKAMEEQMIERGRAEGIEFSYGGVVSSTVDSHRMIEKARELKGEAGQLAFVQRRVAPT